MKATSCSFIKSYLHQEECDYYRAGSSGSDVLLFHQLSFQHTQNTWGTLVLKALRFSRGSKSDQLLHVLGKSEILHHGKVAQFVTSCFCSCRRGLWVTVRNEHCTCNLLCFSYSNKVLWTFGSWHFRATRVRRASHFSPQNTSAKGSSFCFKCWDFEYLAQEDLEQALHLPHTLLITP